MILFSTEEEIRSNERLFSTLFNNSGVGIVLMDSKGKIIKANSKICKMFGYREDEAVGLDRQEVYPSDKSENGWDLYNQLIRKEISSYEIEKQYKRKDGSIFWGLLTMSLLENNEDNTVAIAVIQDIDLRKQAERSILKLNKELTELNDYKDKVISIIAHDLKSPFSSCKQLLENILETFEGLSKTELEQYFQLLFARFLTINQLLEELVLWARTQLNKMPFNPQPLTVGKELKKVITSFQQTADEKEITIRLRYGSEMIVIADLNMFQAIVRNLLSNAIKFSQPKSEISIDTQYSDNELFISVNDSGVGMTEETIKNIIVGRNNTAAFGTNGEKGLGLGLALAKEFVEKNSGKLVIRSNRHTGTHISFSLPVSPN
jgi:two-component system sensor histidine kinase/response regulator